MEMYHFVTKWFFQAPVERVWQEILNMESWPSWWKNYIKVELPDKGGAKKAGARADFEVRGFLPASIHYRLELTKIERPYHLQGNSTGDLNGTGRWVLESRDGGTYVTFYWDVGTSRPLFNWAGRTGLGRLLLEINHDIIMENGFRGLKQRLERPGARFVQPAYHW
jgi:hypothetical protein